jgi:hypothetical protein
MGSSGGGRVKSIVGEAVHDGVRHLTVCWNISVLPEEQVLLTAPAAVAAYEKRKRIRKRRILPTNARNEA